MGEVKLFLYVENTHQFPTDPIKPGAKTGRTLAWSPGDCILVWHVGHVASGQALPLLGHSFVICKMQLLDQPICRGLSPQV